MLQRWRFALLQASGDALLRACRHVVEAIATRCTF